MDARAYGHGLTLYPLFAYGEGIIMKEYNILYNYSSLNVLRGENIVILMVNPGRHLHLSADILFQETLLYTPISHKRELSGGTDKRYIPGIIKTDAFTH